MKRHGNNETPLETPPDKGTSNGQKNGNHKLATLHTGVPGFDEVLGNGIPEFSFNLICGAPGCGKTTLAHQIMFANASKKHPALYFTVLGEPPIKMLRYQQGFQFFDVSRIPGSIRFAHLDDAVLKQGLEGVLAFIIGQVEATQPAIVVVDSFRAVTRSSAKDGRFSLEHFVQRLALFLTSWAATTFMVGEYQDDRIVNPTFTVADGIVWLYQNVERNSVVRKMQVMKMRGQEQVPGLHTFRITSAGLQVFPRITRPEPIDDGKAEKTELLSSGVPGLDDMLHGGIPAGHSVLVAGPSGSGKTVLSMQFIADGIRHGEPGVIVVFERRPADYLKSIHAMADFKDIVDGGMLQFVYLRPLDLSIDETLYEVCEAVRRLGARRVVIDSLSGFELALAPTFRDDFRESLYRMQGSLTALGVTVMMSVEVVDSFTDMRFSPHDTSFLTDIIVLQRYCILQGRCRRVMVVAKHRSSSHSHDLMEYEITSHGLEVMGALPEYEGLLSAVPRASLIEPIKV